MPHVGCSVLGPTGLRIFHVVGSPVVFDASGCAPREYEADACSFTVRFDAPERLYRGSLTSEIGLPLIRPSLSMGWEVESDLGWWCQLPLIGVAGCAGECFFYGLPTRGSV